jgi:hypothetical protein
MRPELSEAIRVIFDHSAARPDSGRGAATTATSTHVAHNSNILQVLHATVRFQKLTFQKEKSVFGHSEIVGRVGPLFDFAGRPHKRSEPCVHADAFVLLCVRHFAVTQFQSADTRFRQVCVHTHEYAIANQTLTIHPNLIVGSSSQLRFARSRHKQVSRSSECPVVTVLAFHVTWSRALARLAQAVWSGRTRYLYTNRTL